MSIIGSIIDYIQSFTTRRLTYTEMTAVLDKLAAERSEKLDWRQSIVDLLKLVDVDSDLAARKRLAEELGYTGVLDGSATMNIWLHGEVMQKLSEHGGKLPNSLKD